MFANQQRFAISQTQSLSLIEFETIKQKWLEDFRT